jgi:hypothetical protein
MKKWSLAILAMIIGGLICPVVAADAGRYSYITVETVEIRLDNDRAVIDVNYRVDEGIQLLVLLIGKSDLKNKLNDIIKLDDARFKELELNHAVLVVDESSYNYGDGSYWFPEHEFGIIIPKLRVVTPQTIRTFEMTRSFPGGIGYFGTE